MVWVIWLSFKFIKIVFNHKRFFLSLLFVCLTAYFAELCCMEIDPQNVFEIVLLQQQNFDLIPSHLFLWKSSLYTSDLTKLNDFRTQYHCLKNILTWAKKIKNSLLKIIIYLLRFLKFIQRHFGINSWVLKQYIFFG